MATDHKEEVRLWFLNDEGLYNMACAAVRRAKTKDLAAERLLADLKEIGVNETPHSKVPYTKSAIRYALRSF